MSKETLNKIEETNKTVEYSGGNVSYELFGQPNTERQKIIIIPGFTEDSLTMKGFAEALAEKGETQVIVPDQPNYYKDGNLIRGLKMSAIDHQADAILAVIKAEGLENEPLDIVAHSLGAPVVVRMAELAKERAELAKEPIPKALDVNEGSHSVFLAPASSNPHERLLLSKDSLAFRFLRDFAPRDAKENKKFDPEGVGKKRAARNFVKNPLKTGKEVLYLSKKEEMYKKLGGLGLKPAVIVFSDDPLQPQRLNQPVTEAYVSGEADYSLSGWSTAVNLAEVGTGDKNAKDAWLDDYRHAGHNDHARHPEHVAAVVLQSLRQ